MLARNFGKIPVILAVFCLAFALVMTGCGGGSSPVRTDDDDDGGGDPPFLGGTLELNAQVWNSYCCCDNGSGYSPFTGGSREIDDAGHWFWNGSQDFRTVSGGTGSIVGGHLSFSIDSPDPNELWDIEDFFKYYFEYFSVASDIFANLLIDVDAEAAVISELRTYGSGYSGYLRRFRYVEGNPMIFEQVVYIYVDQYVHISGTGRTNLTSPCPCDEWGGCDCDSYAPCDCAYMYRTQSFDLNLQPGWNPVHFRNERRFSGGVRTNDITISPGGPDRIRWVLNEWEPW